MAVAVDSGPSLGKATAAECSAADLGPPPGSAVVARHLSHSSFMWSNLLGSWDMVCDGDMPCGKQRDV